MEITRYLDPRNDIAFKKIFGSEQNKDVLIHFLNDILGKQGKEQIEQLTFLNTTQPPAIAAQKRSILDVLCTDAQGIMFIVEMQVAKVRGFEKRAQYYAAKAYCDQAKEGDEYANLKEVIFLAIVDFIMFPDKEGYKSEHVVLDKETHDHHLKDFSFTFLELPKFTKERVEDLTTYEEKWCYFFKHSNNAEDMSRMIANSDHVIQKAYNVLLSHNWSNQELVDYEAVTKANKDAVAREAQVREEGKEEGRVEGEEKGRIAGEEKGRAEEKKAVARKMLVKKQTIADIMEITGLSEEQIRNL